MKYLRICLIFTCMIIFLGMQKDIPINDLLKNPFDLQKFKRIKKGANSGGADRAEHFYKPSTKGMYYHFFLFPPGHGYYGNDTSKKVYLENGLAMITYKPFGKYQYSYIDPTETLIAVYENYNDVDLKELAFIGLDTNWIKRKLGGSFIRKENCFIYTKDSNALVLGIKGSKIKSLQYIRLDIELNKDNIPAWLTKDINKEY